MVEEEKILNDLKRGGSAFAQHDDLWMWDPVTESYVKAKEGLIAKHTSTSEKKEKLAIYGATGTPEMKYIDQLPGYENWPKSERNFKSSVLGHGWN